MRQSDADAQIGTHEFGSSAGVFLVVFAEADHELIEAERIAVVQIKLNKPRSATLVLWCCGAVVLSISNFGVVVLSISNLGAVVLSCSLCRHLSAVSRTLSALTRCLVGLLPLCHSLLLSWRHSLLLSLFLGFNLCSARCDCW